MLDVDGSSDRVVPSGGQPAWSPDGKRIAFTSPRLADDSIGFTGFPTLWVMNADGSGRKRWWEGQYPPEGEPTWSPDGTQVAFMRSIEHNGRWVWDVFVGKADSLDQINLTRRQAQDISPAWSPDGSKIAFASDRDGDYEIYVMNTDGSGQTRLTNSPGADVDPAWSHDGSKIAFASDRDGNYEVYVMNADGTGQTNLTNNQADDRHPAWRQ